MSEEAGRAAKPKPRACCARRGLSISRRSLSSVRFRRWLDEPFFLLCGRDRRTHRDQSVDRGGADVQRPTTSLKAHTRRSRPSKAGRAIGIIRLVQTLSAACVRARYRPRAHV